MAEKDPIRLNYDGDGNPDGFAEFQSADYVGISDGGTGGSYSSLADLRIGLGLQIGSNVQAYDADLTTLSNLVHSDGVFIVSDGTQWTVESGSTARNSLSLGTTDDVTFATLTTTGSVTIQGNLDVQGEFLNTTAEIVVVDDAFVKLNNGNGEVDSGIIIETSDTDDARLFYDVSTNRWVLGENQSYDEILTQDSTDTLTNKTLSGADNTFTNLPNSAFSNSSITVTDGTNSTTIALGDTVTFTGGTGITLTEGSGTITGSIDFTEFDTDNITEGSSNLYYTNARADGRIAVASIGDLSDVTLTSTATGDILRYNGSAFVNEPLNLGTDTEGDYVASLVAGTGITLTNNSGETSTPTVAVDMTAFDTDDLTEGATNLYYTTARWDTKMASADTDDLSEGSTNLYYTDSRVGTYLTTNSYATQSYVDSAVASENELSEMNDVTLTSTATGNILQYNGTAWVNIAPDTDDISEGTNLYFTTARIDSHLSGGTGITYSTGALSIDFTEFDTDDVVEGTTNLYFTNARSRGAVSVTDAGGDGSLSYDNTTGVFTYTGPSASEVRAHFTAGTGIAISSGEISIGQAVGTTDNVQFNNVQVDGTLTSDDITSTNISIDGNATITGNLTVSGTTTSVDSTTVTVNDPLFKYADGNTGNSVDIGFYGEYVQTSTTKYAGLVWDASQSDKFRLFHGVQTEPTSTLDITATGYTLGTLLANLEGNVTGNVTGTVSSLSNHDTDDLAEGTNLYFTTARIDSHLSGGTGISYSSGAIAIDFSEFNTGSITEGSNLFYTDERVQDAVGGQFVTNGTHTGISFTYDDAGDGAIDATVSLASFDTDDLSEGSTNLYYTDTRVGSYLTTNSYATQSYVDNAVAGENELSEMNDVSITSLASNQFLQYNGTSWVNITIDTDDVAEGTNLYYTDTRFDTRLGTKTTDNLTEGSTNLYFTDERAQDALGTALTMGTQTLITVTYDDANNNFDFVVDNDLANYDNSTSGFTTLSSFSGGTNISFSSGTIAFDNTSDLDMNGQKVLFANIYSNESDLPSASTYHGMFAHVHGTGRAYYAHAGNWVELIGENEIGSGLTYSSGSLSADFTPTSTDTLSNKTINFEDNTPIIEFAVTVADVSGNKYHLDGETTASIQLIPGITYRFDQSDSSNSGHPLVFSTTQDGTHNSGSAYTTGVTTNGTPGSSGAYTQIVVDAATADTLYYYCSSHSGMAGDSVVSVQGTSLSASDTDDLSEGSSNLYYTDARARSSVSVTDSGGDGSLSYNSSTGVFTYTGPSASEVRAHFSAGTGVTLSSGEISIGQAVGTSSDVTFNDVTVSGNLTVSGTTTTVNTETINLADNIIVFNSNATGSASENAGIEIERGDDANKTLIWDETNDRWTVGSESFVAGTFIGALTGNVTGTVSDISNHDTDDLSEGATNLYYTTARFDTAFSGKSTTDLTEGTNLYFTNARVDTEIDSYVTGGTGVTVTSGEIAIGQSVGTTDDVTFNEVTADVHGAIHLTAKNASGGTLNVGIPVYISGHSGTEIEVGIADSDDSAKMPAVGIMTASSNANAEADIITHGKFIGINTSAFSVGDELYVSTTGTLTNTVPSGESQAVQKIAVVVRSHATDGEIYVMGAGRTNATPNLNDGNIFIGNASNQVTTVLLSEYIDDQVNTLLTAGSNITLTYDDAAGTLTIAGVEDNLSNNSTDDLAEGSTNLYFTNARADARIAAANVNDLNDVLFSDPTSSDDAKVIAYSDTSGGFVLSSLAGLSGSGEVNTASNVNNAGIGVFKQKTGEDLEFRGINVGSAKLTITNDTANNEIDIDFGSVSIDDLSDVDTTTTAPTSGQALKWSGSAWVPGDASSQVANLTDVTLTSLASTNVLQYNGTAWVNVTLDTDDIGEGSTNLYYTTSRANTDFDTRLSAKTTDNLTEGSTNLYFTNARVDTEIDSYISGGTGVTVSSGAISIGQAVATTSDVTFNDLTVSGNLTVSGTTTTVNTETINLADNVILLNSNETGTPSQNGGIEIERGTETNKTFVWDESTDKWTVGTETIVASTFEGSATNIGATAITDLTEDTSPAEGDFLVTYDVSASALKKVQKSNIAAAVSFSVNDELPLTLADNTSDPIQFTNVGTSATDLDLVLADGTSDPIQIVATSNSATVFRDNDTDTYIKVEATTDDDTIRMATAGTERLVIESTGEVKANGVDVSKTGWILLSSNAVSGSTGTTVDGVFTSTYTNYKIVAHLSGSHTTTQQFQMVLRASSTDDTNSSYSSGVRTFRISADAEFETRNDATTSWNVSGWDGSQTGNAISREISLFGPQSNRRTLFSGTGMTDEVTEQQFLYFGGSFENTTSFDGIKIYPSAGTWTGQINIYGWLD